MGIPPKPLNALQTKMLVELMENPPASEETLLVDLLENRIPPGVDEAAYIKAGFLSAILIDEAKTPLIDKPKAITLLGMMQGGYNVAPLIKALDNAELAALAAEQLKGTLLVFEAFHDITEKADQGNKFAKDIVKAWADAQWFLNKPEVPKEIKMTVFKVPGETNTDDLSPAPDAWSRPDIPLHALAMYKIPREGVNNAKDQINELKEKHNLPVVLSRRCIRNWFLTENQRQILYFGIQEMTLLVCLTNEQVAFVWAEKLHLFFIIPWKMPVLYQLNVMSQI